MPNKNEEKQTKEEQKTEAKKPSVTIAGTFQKLGQEGAKDRKELATKIVDTLAKNGVTKNVRGHPIKLEKVLQQISAMVRDITQERGKDKNSWWSKFVVEENDKGFKLVKKA